MDMTTEELKLVLAEVIADSNYRDCPFADIESEKIEALKAMPTGAFKMVCVTWSVVAQFGSWLGKGIAIGLFIALLALFVIGGTSLLRLWGVFGGAIK